jgi:hypothetical protein
MMDDNMDVDPGSPTSSGHKRAPTFPPASSSANKRLKPILPAAQLLALNDRMGRVSRSKLWQRRIRDAQNEDSESEWRALFLDVLVSLLLELSSRTTNLKDSVIPPLASHDKADSLVNDLTDEEFKEWVNGVQTGVKENDWGHLIVHRTLHLAPEDLAEFDRHGSETSNQDSRPAVAIRKYVGPSFLAGFGHQTYRIPSASTDCTIPSLSDHECRLFFSRDQSSAQRTTQRSL